jgi:hypothetical protein
MNFVNRMLDEPNTLITYGGSTVVVTPRQARLMACAALGWMLKGPRLNEPKGAN